MCECGSHSIINGVQQEEPIMATSLLFRRWFQSPEPTVALRLAGDDEAHMARRLAALDDAPALEGPVLLALVDGEPVAALSLLDRRVVANPFVHTRELVELLRLRAEHISGPGEGPHHRSRPTLLRRAA
jgi:hypothetical protein